MNTIKTYQEDQSAQGRINAWHTAYNVAKSHITGGGFDMFQPPTFRQYAPDPWNVHDVHSIYFEMMGEQGYIGLALFLLLGVLAWLRAQQIIKRCKHDPERKWAADLAAMIQVSLIGYAVAGAFLGMSHFDLPYHLMIILVLAAKFSGALTKSAAAEDRARGRALPHPSSRFGSEHAGPGG